MAYDKDGLLNVATGGAISTGEDSVKSIHHYATNDTLAVVEAANYFDDAADFLSPGDIIIVSGDVDGTPWTQQYLVASISASDVVVVTGSANKTFTSQYVLSVTDLIMVSATAAQARLVVPIAGTIDLIQSVINQAFTTGDATITADIGGVAVTGGVITVTQSGSTEDDVDSAAPSAANTVAGGDVITLTVGGTNDAAGSLANISLLISPT